MIDIDLKIKHYMPTPGNGVYMKEMRLPADHQSVTESHTFDHFSLLASGWVIAEVDGAEEELIGPCVIEIKAGKHHKFRAMTDSVWYCIHATNETDSSKIDDTLIDRKVG